MSASRLPFNRATLLALLRMSLPMVISQGAFAVMIFTDRYFLSQLSPAHMAAGLGGGVAWYFCVSLFNGILAYANALVAQYLGAGEYGKCSRVVTQGLILSILSLPLVLFIGACFYPAFRFMGHDPAQVALEQAYYVVLMGGVIFSLFKTCLASFFAGIGRTGVVMTADVASILMNIPLSYALIFGYAGLPELGIVGAGIGTVISTVFAVLVYLGYYMARDNRARYVIVESFRFDAGITRRYIRLGLPSGVETFLNVAAFNLFLLMFQSYGIAEAASAAIVFNWDILSFVPMLGLNIAMMSLIGRSVGAGDMTRTNEISMSGYLLGIGYSVVLALAFITHREALVELFIFGEDAWSAEIRNLAGFMMFGLSTYVLAEGALQVSAGILRGAGDTRWCMLASVSLHWAMLVAQFLIIKVWNLGPRIAWLAFVIMILCIAATFIWRLTGNHWRDPERLRAVMAE